MFVHRCTSTKGCVGGQRNVARTCSHRRMEAPAAEDGLEEKIEPTLRSSSGPAALALTVVLMLAVDELNPIKVICSYTAGVFCYRHIAMCAGILLCALAVDQRAHIFYYSAKTFFRCTLNNMIFGSVEIIGMDHVPKDGPVILTGNHNNQFVDGIILLTNCVREISFMIAQASWERPLVGFLARAFHSIPVARPQDLPAIEGSGALVLDGTTRVRGEGTLFIKEVQSGCQLKVKNLSLQMKVKEVISDTEILLETEAGPIQDAGAVKFSILARVDQSKMFDTVYRRLQEGVCLGIFPEGGSHDRTDLLPLKAGVSIIALDAFRKHNIRVPIVPVGLNYFGGHKFGGRVVIEFGKPISIPEEMYTLHETDRHAATGQLLDLISTGMRSVIVPTRDYHMQQLIYTCRRLYVDGGTKYSTEETMDLNRRFAFGIQKMLLLQDLGSGGGSPQRPGSSFRKDGTSDAEGLFSAEDMASIEAMRKGLEDYMATLKRLGIKDHQVKMLGWWRTMDLIGRLLYLVATSLLGALPQLMINMPMVWFAGHIAVKEQAKALKGSIVKVAARDVLMSYKIIYCLVLVPFLYSLYAVLLFCVSGWTTTTNVAILIAMPLFSLLGTKASEQGVRAYNDLVPLVQRLMPANKKELMALPHRRKELQRNLRKAVKMFGPRFGDLYHATTGKVDWTAQINDMEEWQKLLRASAAEPTSPTHSEAPSKKQE